MPKSKNKITCTVCDRVISASAFLNHLRGNANHSKLLQDLEDLRIKLSSTHKSCNHCGKEFQPRPFTLNEASAHFYGLDLRVSNYCSKKCSNMPWNTGLTKDTSPSMMRIASSRLGADNPVHKILNDPQKRKCWVDKILEGRADYDEFRKGKSLIEVYGEERATQIKDNMSEAAKQRTVHGHTGHRHSEEVKRAIASKTAAMIANNKHFVSKPQREFYESIDRSLEDEVILEHRVSSFSIDIAIPSKKIAIEVDGDFFHANEAAGFELKHDIQRRTVRNDKRKNDKLAKLGWTVVRFWVSDLEKDKECCLNKVLQTFNSKTSST